MAEYIEINDYCQKKGKRVKLTHNVEEVYVIKDGNGKDIQYKKQRCNFANQCDEFSCPHNIR